MIEISICYFKTRGERRATEDDKRGKSRKLGLRCEEGIKKSWSGSKKVTSF